LFSDLKRPEESKVEDENQQVKKFERKNKGQVDSQVLRRRVSKEDMKMEMLNDDHFD